MNDRNEPATPLAGQASGPVAPRAGGSVGSGSYSSSADEPTRVSDSRSSDPRNIENTSRPQIEGYELLEEVHRGGQGIVFRARQLGTKRDVALKVLLEGAYASDTARRRFEREVELAASLKHPNIVTILDSGISLGRMYFVMEFIDGLRLDQFLRQKQLPIDKTLSLFMETCQAVNFAHQRGVIHRDLKPGNILVDADGKPHILDFGLAKGTKSADPDATVADLSTTGQVIGTLAYMSPEQAAGSIDVDVRSDVYSLGVIFYEALLGRTPYAVNGPLGEVLQRIAHDDPVSPRSVRLSTRFGRQIDDEIETILLKALEKEPARRYQTAGDLARDIEHYLAGEPVEAKRASGLYMLRKTLRKYRWQAAAASIFLLAILTFLVAFIVMYRRESLLRADAEDLRTAAAQKAADLEVSLRRTEEAERREAGAREKAQANERDALRSAESLQRAMVRQKLQRGDLAKVRGDLVEARDSYWDAYLDSNEDSAALWQLRRYYFDSGDAGAIQLSLRNQGAMALSESGTIAAVCDTPASISVRDTLCGQTLAWYSTPDAVRMLSVDDEKTVAAVGNTWLRVWSGERSMTSTALPDRFVAETIALFAGGKRVILIDGSAGLIVDAASGSIAQEFSLRGTARGAPIYQAAQRKLFVPTTVGAEFFSLDDAGRVKERGLFPGLSAGGPRQLTFSGAQGLLVTGEGIDLISLKPGEAGRTTRIVTPEKPWDFVQSSNSGEMLALGAADGRVGIYWNGALENEWQVTHGRLLAVRVDSEKHGVITLDDRGVLTRWTPRNYERTREMVHDKSAAKWVVSADGSSLIMADSAGTILAYGQKGQSRATAIQLPSLVEFVAGRSLADLSLAVSGDGESGVVVSGDRIWYKHVRRPRPQQLRYNSQLTPKIRNVALSQDGRVLGLYVTNESSDRQMISFISPDGARPGGPVRANTAALGQPVEVMGSVVRTMQFIPKSDRLVVARSNGELLMLQPSEDRRAEESSSASRMVWAALDSAAYLLAFDRAGNTLAAACDDGTVRLISVLDVSEISSIPVGRKLNSLSFNETGELLLTRGEDGAVEIIEAATGERISQWPGTISGANALAAWFGRDDAIVVSERDGVFQIRHKGVDGAIAASRAFAQQRRVARRLGDPDLSLAWSESERLVRLDGALGAEAQCAIVEQSLRRLRSEPKDDWIKSIENSPSADILLRLGHAAYEGNRFDLAFRWFMRCENMRGHPLDRDAQRRLAGCEYLLGKEGDAAERLGRLVDESQSWSADTGRLTVEWIAALVANQQVDAARRVVRTFETPNIAGDRAPFATIAAQVLGGVLVEDARELKLTTVQRSIVSVLETPLAQSQWSLYRDDVEFLLGENARRRGELETARAHYQRCIDLARDEWPANWARYRLRQMDEK